MQTAFKRPVLALAILLGLAVAALYAIPLASLPMRYSLLYNEGWNAYHIDHFLQGGVLYPPAASFSTNNYPPLFFVLSAPIAAVTGDAVVAARIVALAGLAITAGGVGAVVYGWTGRGSSGFLAGLIFLLVNGLWFSIYIAMADPQWAGFAFQTAGLAVIAGAASARPSGVSVSGIGFGSLLIAAALFVLGGLVKHNLIAMPACTALWLIWKDWRQGARFLIAAGLVILVALALCRAMFGSAIIEDVLLYPRVITLSRGAGFFEVFKGFVIPVAGLGLLFGWLGPASPWRGFVTIYLLAGLAMAYVMTCGDGVFVNAFFDSVVAVSLALGLVLDSWLRNPGRARVSALILLAPGLLLLGLGAPQAFNDTRTRYNAVKAASDGRTDRLIEAIARTRGPVACEHLAWCYWAGKPFTVDFWNTATKEHFGILPSSRFDQMMAEGRFSAIQLTTSDGDLLFAAPYRQAMLTGWSEHDYVAARVYVKQSTR